MEIDEYFGYLAWGYLYLYEEGMEVRGVNVLRSLIKKDPSQAEAYLVLWNYYYIKKNYALAEDLAEQASVRVINTHMHDYSILICLYHAKALFKNMRYVKAFERIQYQYFLNTNYTVLLY